MHDSMLTRATRCVTRSKAVRLTLVAIALSAAVLVTGCGGSAKFTKSYGTPGPCQITSVPVAAKPGMDLARQGDRLVSAYEGMQGIGDVTLDVEQRRVDVEWCVSLTNEQSVLTALQSTGVATLGRAQTKPLQP